VGNNEMQFDQRLTQIAKNVVLMKNLPVYFFVAHICAQHSVTPKRYRNGIFSLTEH
jgi:hypothetical protein